MTEGAVNGIGVKLADCSGAAAFNCHPACHVGIEKKTRTGRLRRKGTKPTRILLFYLPIRALLWLMRDDVCLEKQSSPAHSAAKLKRHILNRMSELEEKIKRGGQRMHFERVTWRLAGESTKAWLRTEYYSQSFSLRRRSRVSARYV